MEKILVTRSSMPPYEEYIEMIKPLWESHWLTNMGKFHQELEKKLKEYLSVSNIALLVNGHMSLEMALQAFDFPKGAEIITTPFTFVSTTHAIVRCGFTPIFCDVKLDDGTIDESKIEQLITENTVAIVPVHVYGNPCNIEDIEKIAKKHNLKVIYDAAHAFGVEYNGMGIGNYGDASMFSFHATKVYNTIEGGAIVSSNEKLIKKINDLKDFGIRDAESVVDIGTNGKMNEFCAAMGICNLRHINDSIKSRKQVWDRYLDGLKGCKGIRVLKQRENSTPNYAYFPIVVEDSYHLSRDGLFDLLTGNEIFARKYFYPLTCDQICYHNKFESIELKNARLLAEEILCLPIYEDLTFDMIDKIVAIIKK